MDGQQGLLLTRPQWATGPLGDLFVEHRRNHPEVGEHFVRLAREWRAAKPGERVGAKAIFEVLRWNYAVGAIPTTSDEPFKLDNRLSSRYARWAAENHADLAAAFETRRLA